MSGINNLFSGKKVLIFGLGLQGGGAGSALFAKRHGAKVKITDLKSTQSLKSTLSKLPEDITQTLGRHDPLDIDWADIIIKNPGVSHNSDLIQYALQSKKQVYMPAALYLKYSKLKTIGITGTRGKSTTTRLIYSMLNRSFPDQVLIGGNIPGQSPLELLDEENNKKYAVLELSSFQLAGCDRLQVSPQLAVVTNIYQDHLNRYNSMDSYIKDKLTIVKYQGKNDITILNKLDDNANKFQKLSHAQIKWFTTSNLKSSLIGDHNKQNIAAAQVVALSLGIDKATIKRSVQDFRGLPYRLEKIAEKNGITYINDTTSTTPISTIKAIQSLKDPIILIIGGESKNLETDNMIDLVCLSNQVTKIIILGSKNNKEFLTKINNCKDKIIGNVSSMREAMQLAVAHAKSGDTVLLSPGFASFDLFNNEFERGDQFNREVEKLQK